LRSFVVKRFFRIYPLYLISFLLGLAAIGLSDSVKTIVIYVPQLLQHVFMLDLYQIGWQMQGPTWSIYPEIAFSLLLPVVVLVFGHRREGIMLTLAVIFIYFNGQGGPYVTMFGYFFAGAALYLSEQRLARLLPASWLTNAILLTGFAAAVAILIVQRDFVGEALVGTYLSKLYGWLGLGLHSLAFAAILMIFIAAQFCAPVRAILSRRTMVFFGHISYGIYILHMPVLWVIRQAHFDFKSGLFTFADPEGLPGSPLVFALVYAPAIILLAWLAHRAIELPFMSLGAKAARRPIAAPQIWTCPERVENDS
jgi:peptidoglycan/LPS O-acetylase OafA/YrhL